ncbi:MAG: putative integral membrane protein [Chloroflexi bacterium OLB14]|nr:MAG: putative integral membrane protein [Chloroflexi bacterium OLB14]
MGLIVSLFLGFVPMFLFAVFVYWLDRYEKEPKLLLGAAFFWGVIIAGGGAFIINTVLGIGVYVVTSSDAVTNFATASIIAPIVEETLKGLAVAVVFFMFRKEFDSVLDGIIYGSMVGLGFSAIENTLYIYRDGYSAGGWGGLLALAFIRVILVGWMHAFFTAFTGIGFAIARLNKNIIIKIFAPIVGIGIAISAHAFHNTFGSVVGSGGLDSLGLTILADMLGYSVMIGIIVWVLVHERNVVKRQLAEEVASGLISQAQYQKAQSPITLTTAGLSGRATSQFYLLLGELAHKKRATTETW